MSKKLDEHFSQRITETETDIANLRTVMAANRRRLREKEDTVARLIFDRRMNRQVMAVQRYKNKNASFMERMASQVAFVQDKEAMEADPPSGAPTKKRKKSSSTASQKPNPAIGYNLFVRKAQADGASSEEAITQWRGLTKTERLEWYQRARTGENAD